MFATILSLAAIKEPTIEFEKPLLPNKKEYQNIGFGDLFRAVSKLNQITIN